MDKEGYRKNFFRVYITVVLILTAIYFIPQILRIGPSLYASMDEVYLCSGPTSRPLSSIPNHRLNYIDNISTLDHLYACGFLKTDGQEANIGVVVENTIGRNVTHYFEEYQTGWVFLPITIKNPANGVYTILIMKGRNILATSQFEINLP